MIRKKVKIEFADGELGDEQEVILLQEDDIAALLKAIRELDYNKRTDIFESIPEIEALAQEFGVE